MKRPLAALTVLALAATLIVFGLAGCGASQTEAELRAKEVPCWLCEGTKVCPVCHGTKEGVLQRDCEACVDPASKKVTGECQYCGGKGVIRAVPCPTCDGAKVCPVCRGSAQGASQQRCMACYSVPAKKSTGACQECDGRGLVLVAKAALGRTQQPPCWSCDGAKVCPVCHGTAQGVNQRECYACYNVIAKKSTGACQECDGSGFVRATKLGEAIQKAGGKPPRR